MTRGKSALADTLRRQILTLELEPDQDLDEARLSADHGISRTPVRDVLRLLAGEGYIEIRENRGARVIPMNHETLRDFFQVAPLVYEAVGRLAVQNVRPGQLQQLEACQMRFRAAEVSDNAEAMVVENTAFHGIIGTMARSTFLQPSLNRLLIDHARIGHTFFRPKNEKMRENLVIASHQHDALIAAIGTRNEGAVVKLVHEHWELSRNDMALFVVPKGLSSASLHLLGPDPARRARQKQST